MWYKGDKHMKKTIILAAVFVILHHVIGIGVYYILQQNIMMPTRVIGALYLVGWGALSFWLYQKNTSMKEHLTYMSVPVVVLFGLFTPLANLLNISMLLMYFAPMFSFATTIVYMTTSYATWKVLVVAIIIMILVAWLGAKMKQSESMF